MKFYDLDLTLFGEGAAAGAEGGAQAAPAESGKPGDLSKVLYGSEADSAAPVAEEQQPEVKTTSNTLEERKKSFRDLINGEYKDVYGEEVQRLIDRRFAETKNLQKQVDDAKPILDKLAARYNVLDGDMSKLAKAIDDDSSYWQAAAEEAGMSEEAYRQYQQMRQQNAELLRMQQEQTRRERADQQMRKWFEESEALKTQFPDFDFLREMENTEFMKLISHGTPVEHAYKVLHFDDIMNSTVQNTVQRTEQAVVNNIRAKGARPAENGTASQSAFTVKRSASQLNKADREEIARRVKAGEMISF